MKISFDIGSRRRSTRSSSRAGSGFTSSAIRRAVRAAQRLALERRRGLRNDERVELFATNLARVVRLSAVHVRNLIRTGEYLGEERLRRLVNLFAWPACRRGTATA